jgi:crotonobetainyl-CoA:carnitine CoA-transferase CaiB-like acyl-CoA transferase
MASLMLADLGADVIRVEEPGGGRRAREERALNGEPPEAYSIREWQWRSTSPIDRNKRSMAVDLREERGRVIAQRLIQTADVVIEGFRPGVMSRLELDYETARSLNPAVVYCSISGFGHVGPRAAVTGHDLTYLAYAGALSLIGDSDGKPVVPINVIADYAAGSLRAVVAILVALMARDQTGEGRFIDLSMTDGIVALLAVEVARCLALGVAPKAGTTYLTGGAAYYNVYVCGDDSWLAVACNEPHFFRELCVLLGVPHLAERQLAGPEEQAEMYEILSERFRTRAGCEWCELLQPAGLPVEVVRTVEELLADEHLRVRGTLIEVEHPDFGKLMQVGETLFGSGHAPARIAGPPGSDSRALLSELGYPEGEIDELFTDNVIVESIPSP